MIKQQYRKKKTASTCLSKIEAVCCFLKTKSLDYFKYLIILNILDFVRN